MFLVATRNGDRRAELPERPRDREANARAAAGHECGLSLQHRRRKHKPQVYIVGVCVKIP